MSHLIEYSAPSGLSLIIAMAGNVRAAAMVPTRLEIPEAGNSDLKIYLTLYDADGEMQAPDAAPTVAVENDAGTSRSGNLRDGAGATTTMVLESTGVYWLYYRVASTAVKENLTFTFTSVTNAKTLKVKANSRVDDITELDTKIDYISEDIDVTRTYGSAEAGSDASTLVCSTLLRPTGAYVDWHLFMLTGANAGSMRRVSTWLLTTSTATVANAFANPIAAGDSFQLCSPMSSGMHIIGYNDPANGVDTSQIAANRDGSLLERAEDIRNLADKRVAGRKQYVQMNVTSPANNLVTTLATVTTQACVVEDVIIRAKTAAPADLTTCAMNAGTAGIIHLIVVGLATQANLNAVDKQVGSTDLAEIPVGATITMDLQGTGPTAVDLIVTIGYRACVDGGYINPV